MTMQTFMLKFNYYLIASIKLMKKNTVNILLLLSVCFAMNACGTKGPLYIPEQEYPQAAQANK